MKSQFADNHWKAAVTEIQTLENMDVWDVVDKPGGKNLIDGTWTLKVKQ